QNINISGGSATVSPSQTSTYQVSGTSTAGCISTNTLTISVSVYSLPVIIAANGTLCAGNIFTIIPAGASTYSFSSGTATVNPLSTTSYTVSGSSSVGCVSANAAVITVSVSPLPTISVSGGSICSGNGFTLNPGGAVSYSFSS